MRLKLHHIMAKVPHKTNTPKNSMHVISSPSLVGQSAILNQAVLLAPVHRFSAPSRFSQWHFTEALAVTVAGPLRHLPDSLLSLAAPDSTV